MRSSTAKSDSSLAAAYSSCSASWSGVNSSAIVFAERVGVGCSRRAIAARVLPLVQRERRAQLAVCAVELELELLVEREWPAGAEQRDTLALRIERRSERASVILGLGARVRLGQAACSTPARSRTRPSDCGAVPASSSAPTKTGLEPSIAAPIAITLRAIGPHAELTASRRADTSRSAGASSTSGSAGASSSRRASTCARRSVNSAARGTPGASR